MADERRVSTNGRTHATVSRRLFLSGAAAVAVSAAVGAGGLAAAPQPRMLTVARRTLEVLGRSASGLGVTGSDGTPGLVLAAGEAFAVNLQNSLDQPTILHWHGQTPPPGQDGVAETGLVSPLAPTETRRYRFSPRPGTHWMHSHQGLQEQSLLAAPLIVRTQEDERADIQDVAVLLQDFTFKSPDEILATLSAGQMSGMSMSGGGMQGMSMSGADTSGTSSMNMSGMQMSGMDMSNMDMGASAPAVPADLNDVAYDAYLANDRTLDDPLIVRTERNGRVRIRLINGSASTAYWIDLGNVQATLVAVDGNDVMPLIASHFPIAQAQRLDLVIDVPADAAVPVIAQVEGRSERTGFVLAAPGASILKLSGRADTPAPAVDLSLERQLMAVRPLSQRAPDRTLDIHLTGSMMPYAWGLNGQASPAAEPLTVRAGERVLMRLINDTTMAHPMHLHGHHFQVTSIGGQAHAGAIRDTVLVPAQGTVDVSFDADNPGRWLFHCHNLYHMAAGMMTQLVYA